MLKIRRQLEDVLNEQNDWLVNVDENLIKLHSQEVNES